MNSSLTKISSETIATETVKSPFIHTSKPKAIFLEISMSSMVQSYRRKLVAATCILFRLGHICLERADQVRHLNQFLVRA